MKIISSQGDPELATVYVAAFENDRIVEFVEAREPGVPKKDKWVMIVSTQLGCPVGCPMCDAGGQFRGNLTKNEILGQIDYIISLHPRQRVQDAKKLKIQFARMGEPSLNSGVLEVLKELPERYEAPGLIPCVATIAPEAGREWLDALINLRTKVYGGRLFQLQLSINSTDQKSRDRLMPVSKIPLEDLNLIAAKFYKGGPRKIALNFACAKDIPIDAAVIKKYFNPEICLVKITPLNPTERSAETGLETALPFDAPESCKDICNELSAAGFEVIVSIGDTKENEIGSNCGMAIKKRGIL